MDIQQVTETTFVLLQAEWLVAKGRELIEALDPTHVIVRHSDPQQYYLYTVKEALSSLKHAVDDIMIDEAFNLHQAQPTQLLEAHTNAERADDRCIVQENGQLIGFYDATVPPVIRERWNRETQQYFNGCWDAMMPLVTDSLRGESQQSQPASEASRSVIAEFPEEVALGEVTSLLVSLSALEVDSRSIPVGALPRGATIDIIVQARRGFALQGRGEGSLQIPDTQETLPLQFKLRSTALGLGHICVLVFYHGIAVGKMILTPMVKEGSTNTRTASPSIHEQSLAPISVRLPDLSLLIEEVWADGRRAFTLKITSPNPSHNLNLMKFGPIPFQRDPGPYFQELYRDIESYALATPTDKAITAQKLATKGDWLFSALFPPEAQSMLWDLKEQISSVLIQSEEPWIPWELCKLSGKANGRLVEGPFFCEAFACTRWLPGHGFKPTLKLENIAVVAPSNSGLASVSQELDFLLSLAQVGGRRVTRIPARFLDVQQALASGQYDGWHFIGHGDYRVSDPNRSAIHLEDGEFTPEQLVGVVANLGLARPLVFLNACRVGRSGMSLTGIGGWAERFLAAGAGAFIGPYWSVYDQAACDFPKQVYNRLCAGVPLGRAIQEARLAIKALGDPTWLAYTVFADPLAIVQRERPLTTGMQ